MTKINRKNICLTCSGKIIPAGSSNQIDGRRFKGLDKYAAKEWVVCENCYKQDPNTGDWHKKG